MAESHRLEKDHRRAIDLAGGIKGSELASG